MRTDTQREIEERVAKQKDMIRSLKETYDAFQIEFKRLKDSYNQKIGDIEEQLKDTSSSGISIVQNLSDAQIINLWGTKSSLIQMLKNLKQEKENYSLRIKNEKKTLATLKLSEKIWNA